MATLRRWLDGAKVDWQSLKMVVHTLSDDSYCPGWGSGKKAVLFDFTKPGALDVSPHPLLDHNFNDGYGAPQAPRFIAQDKTRIYFPCQYDGSTWLEVVEKDLDAYMDPAKSTPYPGG